MIDQITKKNSKLRE
jgi:hypothetical protein